MNLSNVNVVLLGHGVDKGGGADEFVLKHSQLLRSLSLFENVYESFVRQEPYVESVLKQLTKGHTYIVPMFMCPGFILQKTFNNLKNNFRIYSNDFKPENCSPGESFIYFCEPIGTHYMMADIIEEKAIEVLKKFPFPRFYNPDEVSLFIAAHGCSKDSESRETLQRHINKLLRQKLFYEIHSVFLEEDPPINACYRLAKTQNIVVVPFFAGNGPHVREDIPVLLGEPRKNVIQRIELGLSPWNNPTILENKRVWYAEPVGNDIRIIDIIIRRVLESAFKLEFE